MRRFWNASEVAEYLGYSLRKVRDDDANRRIPSPVRFGRLRKWDSLELARWADAGCPPRNAWEAMKTVPKPSLPETSTSA